MSRLFISRLNTKGRVGSVFLRGGSVILPIAKERIGAELKAVLSIISLNFPLTTSVNVKGRAFTKKVLLMPVRKWVRIQKINPLTR